jgi:uncharacterized membrane protein
MRSALNVRGFRSRVRHSICARWFTSAPVIEIRSAASALKYDPPAGKVGAGIARHCGEAPEQQSQEDLQHFKKIMESGTADARAPARTDVARA